ncbi:hypothetical protein ACHWQZ_G012498 [Mnemiopsis leidyi]
MAISIPVSTSSVAIQLQHSSHYNIRCYDAIFRVLAGQCHLNGHKLDKDTSSVTLNSLDSHSRLSLNTGSNASIPSTKVKQCLVEVGTEEDHKIIDKIGAVILISPSDSSTSLVRSTYKRLWAPLSEEEPLVKLDYFELFSGLNKAVCISGDWSDPIKTVTSSECRVAVCGPQNSGKSTLCRYAVNKLLERHKTVLFLEGDIGQSELTPSGLVTLSVLREPLLNPPFCNRSSFVSDLSLSSDHLSAESYCVGVVSPSQVMNEYLEKMKLILDKAKKLNKGGVPLVVNFMGWTKGFGVALHADILRMLEPSHVLNLQTNSTKDLPPILELLEIPGILPEDENKIQTKPQVLNIPGYTGHSSTAGFQAFELRHLALLNYFSPIYSRNNSSILPPYKVRWSDVAVIIPYGIEEKMAAYSLNCSVVALLTGRPVEMSRDTEDIRVVEEEAGYMKCLGLAIIRAIDINEKVFYINTPVDKSSLDQVYVMKHTVLPVPHVPSGSLPMPYVSNLAASEILGMGSRSQRANLKRRYRAVS